MVSSHKKTIYEALGREPVHPFPARMAPGIALEILSKSKPSLRVLDPMMGSATVLALARKEGHRAIGVDIDPLAVLISKVWTTAIDVENVREKAAEVLHRARLLFKNMDIRNAYPQNADEETKQFTRYWFDGYARAQLASLALSISRVHGESVRDVLWCGFSRLIISKQSGASLAMDLSHSRPHRSFDRAPTKPFPKFISAMERVLSNCLDIRKAGRGPAPSIFNGDARDLPVGSNSIDLVLTSPPYLNAIDYMRCSKFSLIWMGYTIPELRRLRINSVGAEASKQSNGDSDVVNAIMSDLKLRPTLKQSDQAILLRYIDDMHVAITEVARVLKSGGKAVYVVGENTVRGTFIRNSNIVSSIADSVGLRLLERRTRSLPANRRYLPPPTRQSAAAMDTRMRREVVLAFSKSR